MQRKPNSEIPIKLSPNSSYKYMCYNCWIQCPGKICPKCGQPTQIKNKYRVSKKEYHREYRQKVREKIMQNPNRRKKIEFFGRSKDLKYYCHNCCSHCETAQCLCCGAGPDQVQLKRRYQKNHSTAVVL